MDNVILKKNILIWIFFIGMIKIDNVYIIDRLSLWNFNWLLFLVGILWILLNLLYIYSYWNNVRIIYIDDWFFFFIYMFKKYCCDFCEYYMYCKERIFIKEI